MWSWACKGLAQIHPCKPPQKNRKYHMQILYELESHAPSGPIWAENPSKINWKCYSTDLQAALHRTNMEIRDADTLERAADQFSSAIITAYKRNCLPLKIQKIMEYMEELGNLSNVTMHAYRKKIREAKGKSWTSFCSNIEKGAEGPTAVRNPIGDTWAAGL